MISNKKIVCIVILVIIAIIFVYINQEYFFPVKESALFGTVESVPQEDERAAYNDNKANTGNITTMTNDRNLENVDAQISDCQKLIDEINSIIPRKIQDIKLGTVSQTDNLDDVKIQIGTITEMSLDPITNTNGPSSVWTINAVLPRGKQGPPGIQGEKGETGDVGEPGQTGPQGQQGPWGKDCDKC